MEPIFMMVAMLAIFYFILIRPENKRKKQAQEMRDSLKKGDTITTIGGIVGKVVITTPNTLIIETSEDRVRLELTRWAVSTVGVQTGEQPENPKKKKDEKKEDASEPVNEFPAPESEEK